jgi:acetyl/propionyl-CoA carboxylase alpha subunit/acetyl-CoA carboxylase carboxyltransferase component
VTLASILVANRGEIAVRVIRAAQDLGIRAHAVYSEDDADSLHVRRADVAHQLPGRGAGAYLDAAAIVALAREHGCEAIHPGYGFLSENAAFAAACVAAGIVFVGPRPELLELFGDKAAARELAASTGVPIVAGSHGAVTLDEARSFLVGLGEAGAVMIKAISGGGGRGMRAVHAPQELDAAYARCQSEALAAFGNGAVYVEQLLPRVHHIEVQIAGDGTGDVSHLWERECSVQRRNQKLIEVAPAPNLSSSLRDRIVAAALRMAAGVRYASLGTFEFLVDGRGEGSFTFIEANARLQVEHTVTEMVTGLDLVQAQLELAAGRTLAEVGLDQGSIPAPRGFAIQVRVNAERLERDGSIRPAAGALTTFEPPSGPGIRVDTCGYAGYSINPNYDSLLAKVIGHAPSASFADSVRRTARALAEFEIAGAETNLHFLKSVLDHPDFAVGAVYTRWLEEHLAELITVAADDAAPTSAVKGAGATIDRRDPLAALTFYRQGTGTRGMGSDGTRAALGPPGTSPIRAPLQGTVIQIDKAEGEAVREGEQIAVMSALKMEHVIKAEFGGIVRRLTVAAGDTVMEDEPLAFIEVMDVGERVAERVEEVDLDYIRPSLQALFGRRRFTLDENRPEAVERRHSRGRRTVRENITQLIDPGSWVEYGALTIAGQRTRRPLEELIRKTPADGLVAGIGSINGDLFDSQRARTMFISYDDTVFAGTQGVRGHDKTDRMMDLANELSLPLIFHAEGAGGRSGDTEGAPNIHPSVRTFEKMAQLSGKVPMIGVTAGWCYAGNASILGLTDIIIATEDALIAMGGPATIEGGGMGAFLPEEVGPISDIAPAGTVDVVVKNHDEAIATAKKCLSYFQGSIRHWEAADQRLLRHIIPENRARSFDVRKLIEVLADRDSVLELRPSFGHSMVTAFVRIEGHPFGLTVNNNAFIGGAIDSPGSDKVARFWQICDAFNIPIIALVDTPGMMVGPEVEKTGLVRHCSRLFVTGANLESPRFSVILRKGYALGSLAVMTGSSRAPVFTVAWPDSEFGGMNVEAGVLLSHRDALGRIEDVDARAAEYERLVAEAYERGSALNSASVFGVDDVIDPAETRRWIVMGLESVPHPEPLRRGRRTFLDTW